MQQGSSALEEGRSWLYDGVDQLAPLIRAAGGIPALYEVWPTIDRAFDVPGVRYSYRTAAQRVNGLFLPAGTAWQEAWQRNPSLVLYEADGLHPNSTGTFLAALVMVEQLTGRTCGPCPPSRMPAAPSCRSASRPSACCRTRRTPPTSAGWRRERTRRRCAHAVLSRSAHRRRAQTMTGEPAVDSASAARAAYARAIAAARTDSLGRAERELLRAAGPGRGSPRTRGRSPPSPPRAAIRPSRWPPSSRSPNSVPPATSATIPDSHF